MLNRRNFIIQAGITTTGLALYGCKGELRPRSKSPIVDYLIKDQDNLCDLPPGFSYQIIARKNEKLTDGLICPAAPDGMKCFTRSGGGYILICNNEIDKPSFQKTPPEITYDKNCSGGTMTIVLDKNINKLEHYISLSGTVRNCAGGTTPWGTWLSCEETTVTHHEIFSPVSKMHGYVFEVDPLKAANAEPLYSLGRFKHEAAFVDSQTGYVYLTEDQADSCFYRFRPNEKFKIRGEGVLEALMVINQPQLKTKHFGVEDLFKPMEVTWVPIENPNPKTDTVRYQGQKLGAAIFSRGEGLISRDDEVYFTATGGGPNKNGQIFRLYKTGGKEFLELYTLGSESLKSPDNMTISPSNHLIICEDVEEGSRIVALAPDGTIYYLAQTSLGEWTGPTFSPDGKYLFANLQARGLTLAITGPWNIFQPTKA